MKRFTFSIWWVVTVCFLVTCASVYAQGTNTPPATPDPNGLPFGVDALKLALVPFLTFIITWALGKIPPLPKGLLPVLTPVIGVLVGSLTKWATDSHWPLWLSAVTGAASVAIFETLKNATNAGPESALTPTPTPPKT